MKTEDKIIDLKDTAICRIYNTNNTEEINDILIKECDKSYEKGFKAGVQSQKQKIIEEIKKLEKELVNDDEFMSFTIPDWIRFKKEVIGEKEQ